VIVVAGHDDAAGADARHIEPRGHLPFPVHRLVRVGRFLDIRPGAAGHERAEGPDDVHHDRHQDGDDDDGAQVVHDEIHVTSS
jgi:hypothetical protein